MKLGGLISGEHGIGRAKKRYFLELTDPATIDLMRRIKRAFDPTGILNPGKKIPAQTPLMPADEPELEAAGAH
jgi:FAD/FMN-containing dehydrogenase